MRYLLLILLALCSELSLGQHGQYATFQAAQQEDSTSNLNTIGFPTIWSHFGGNSRHQSRALLGPSSPTLSNPTWIADGDATTTYIPIPQTGIVVDTQRVYAIATNPTQPGSSFAVAFNRTNGDFEWATPIPSIILDSWSTPAIDPVSKQLLIAIGDQILALNTATGSQIWSTQINGIVVNASPVITDDLGESDRAFITNYSFGGGNAAKLICVNIDPFNNSTNPYQPGEIVWEALLNGDCSGNTPAYTNGRVFVSTSSNASSLNGTIQAFDATQTTSPNPIWSFTNTINKGFFSGVAVARGHLYASSYSFTGLQYSANTVKLDLQSGQLIWSVPTNRTDSTPVVLDNGDVIVSGGVAIGAFDFLPFFGSLPSIQYIKEDTNNTSVIWDSALDTHDDQNSNGIWDFGESFLSIGGWTHQPIAISIDNTPLLIVGTLPQSQPAQLFGHNTHLSILDLTKSPSDSGFVVEQISGTGSTPAMLGSWIYSPSEQGIQAFAPTSITPIANTDLLLRYTQGKITLKELSDRLSK
ncbi:MAG: PQQ-binding-like beta-propeller repeat protein [Phycisphaerales bacterium]|nr:PQQ-binding-like beta-propeller repeat protein [Phycisphaerales bacterium]